MASFFAGCGGLDLGFEQAGFRVAWANESDSAVRDTYVRNHPNTELVLGDICGVKPEDIPDCDGFIGGPPCQSWSVAGRRRGLDDERGRLFLAYIELIKAKSPKFFLIENVKGLLDDKFKEVFADFIARLEAAGYNVQWRILDALYYGVPQNRERVFIVGFRKGMNVAFGFPPTGGLDPISLSRAIGDIVEKPREFVRGEKIMSDNTVRPNHDVYAGDFGPYYRGANRRRPWERPSFTIHATGDCEPLHPSSPKMLFFGHGNWAFQPGREGEYRRLSVRECARIQTFPDSFFFDSPSILAQYRMIGNAVPPRLGRALAEAIHRALSSERVGLDAPAATTKFTSAVYALVGYYKDDRHLNLIRKNMLYYVRSDGRRGSLFREDCSEMPEFLLLHHEDAALLYELDGEEPILADGSFLRTLGFEVSGETYLCFRLKGEMPIAPQAFGGFRFRFRRDRRGYSPYFDTMEKLIDNEI